MYQVPCDFKSELKNLAVDDWFDALDDLAEEYGHYEPLGGNFAAAFIESGPKLLVTFENHSEIIANSEEHEPIGFRFVRAFGWSHLAIVARDDSWFRDEWIYRYIDRLIDDGFFEDFESVLFYGNHRGGYAATAYSVAAPGSRVLALRPVATLSPSIAGWDRRYMKDRRLDFTTRYGYAPAMVEGADRCYVISDPGVLEDSLHTALFTGTNTTRLRVPYLSDKIDSGLSEMGILNDVVQMAMEGTLDPLSFAQLFRARHRHLRYLRFLVRSAIDQGRTQLAAQVCRAVLADQPRPYFARQLRELENELTDAVAE